MLSSTVAIVILGITCVAMVSLGALVFFVDKKQPANQMFSLWMLSLSAWALSLMAFFGASSASIAEMWMRASYATAVVGAVAFFYFATQFPRPTALVAAVHIANFLFLFVFISMMMFTDLIVIGVGGKPYATSVRISMLGWYLYAGYLLIHFLSAHVILFLKYRKSKGIERIQLRYVLWSVFIGGEIFGVFFNLLLPSPIFRQWDYIWLGPAATAAIIVPFVAYAVTKHNLFNVKGIVTEITVLFTIVFLIVDALLTDSVTEFVFKLIVVLGVTALGSLLIFRLNQDEKRRNELERLADELALANRELTELDKLKSDFISIASHQLRTPVSVMKGYLSLIDENAYGHIGPELRDKVRQMYRMNDRLVHLINNMLNVSRIEKEKMEFTCESFDIVSVINDAIEEMNYKASEKHLYLNFEHEDGQKIMVFADEEKVSEAVVNLIDNAVKYTERGGIRISLEVRGKKDDVLVRISDTGIGIPEEAMGKLFTKFYRPKRDVNLTTQGTGLGLFVCKMFIEGVGGTIGVESSDRENGTTVYFSVPFSPSGQCKPD